MIRRILTNVWETTSQSERIPNVAVHNPFKTLETSHFGWLTNVAPCFPINASNIRILTEPNQFYECLINFSESAKNRITMASLYFGTEELEKKIVNCILSNEHFQNRTLKVDVLLDYTRGSRFSDNSRTTLLPLLRGIDGKSNNNCNISLYHTPELRGTLKKIVPHRWNEMLGLQHMKLYIFDDNLIISGANLSNDYFTNRQDRYFVINDRELCNFYCELVRKVQSFSFHLDCDNKIQIRNSISPCEGPKYKFVENAFNMISNFMENMKNKYSIDVLNDDNVKNDTYIFPLVQMGQLGITQDAEVTQQIFQKTTPGSTLKIATGYFNLTRDYMETLIHETEANVHILMAHPKANGFLGAKGLAGEIPFAYCSIAQKFMENYTKNGQDFRFKLLEYLRTGWTYHGKGLWYYPGENSLPCATLVGSPNFGERSVKRDLETQLVIVSENIEFRRKLHNECEHLYKFGLGIDEKRQIPAWVHGFVYFFRSFF